MRALVLNATGDLAIRTVDDPGEPGPGEVRVRIGAVGICGSDLHYYEHGRIGDFVVTSPMILGHESAGVVESFGDGVEGFKKGDLVALEPGVPCRRCNVCRTGRYNLCRNIRFWATPPYDGSLAEYVVHPADFTYRLPDGMSLAQGALVEPLAVAVHACNTGRVAPGSSVAIVGAGTIGLACLLIAQAYGATEVAISDVENEKLDRARALGASTVVDAKRQSLSEATLQATMGHGVAVGFEASGHPSAVRDLIAASEAGGRVVMIGMGTGPIHLDTIPAMVKEVEMLTIFRYRHAYPTAIKLIASGQIETSPLVTHRFGFERALEAFEFAKTRPPAACKILIELI